MSEGNDAGKRGYLNILLRELLSKEPLEIFKGGAVIW